LSISLREFVRSASAGTAQVTQLTKTPWGKVLAKARKANGTLHAKVDEVKQHLYQSSETLQDKVEGATARAKGMTNQVGEKVPPQVAGRVEQLTETVRQRSVPTAAVVLSVFGLVVLRGLLPRHK
jgi:DNA uptake protein ComE-like DNA-binding protein